jgi:hypothetical protein
MIQADNAFKRALESATETYRKAIESIRDEALTEGDIASAVSLQNEINRLALYLDRIEKNAPAPMAVERNLGYTLSEPPEDAVEFQGRHYKLYVEKQPWWEAKAACRKRGGYMASLGSVEERQFVNRLAGRHSFWLGATDAAKEGRREGDWTWVTGEKLDKDMFDFRPDNMGGKEHYLLVRDNKSWNDSWGGDMFLDTICEWQPLRNTAEELAPGERPIWTSVNKAKSDIAKPRPPEQQPPDRPIFKTVEHKGLTWRLLTTGEMNRWTLTGTDLPPAMLRHRCVLRGAPAELVFHDPLPRHFVLEGQLKLRPTHRGARGGFSTAIVVGAKKTPDQRSAYRVEMADGKASLSFFGRVLNTVDQRNLRVRFTIVRHGDRMWFAVNDTFVEGDVKAVAAPYRYLSFAFRECEFVRLHGVLLTDMSDRQGRFPIGKRTLDLTPDGMLFRDLDDSPNALNEPRTAYRKTVRKAWSKYRKRLTERYDELLSSLDTEKANAAEREDIDAVLAIHDALQRLKRNRNLGYYTELPDLQVRGPRAEAIEKAIEAYRDTMDRIRAEYVDERIRAATAYAEALAPIIEATVQAERLDEAVAIRNVRKTLLERIETLKTTLGKK